MSFWDYFFALFANLPPQVGILFAKLIGGAVALVFFPPATWRGGVTQIAVSFIFSHYAAEPARGRWFTDWPMNSVHALLSFSGWAVMSGMAAILKRLKGDPDRTLSLLDSILSTYQKWRNLGGPDKPDNTPKPGNDAT